MQLKNVLAAAFVFGIGITSVMGECKPVKTGFDEDAGAVYATGLTGQKLIALRYNTQERFDVLSAMMFEICSDMELCAYKPLVRGECFSQGGEMIHTLMISNAPTEEVLDSLEAFANRLIASDDQSAATSDGEESEARRIFDDMYDRSMEVGYDDLDY